MDSTIIREPKSEHKYTIIFLHGRGSNATEFDSDFFESQASDGKFLQDILPNTKWILPQASLFLSSSGEDDEYQWFDIFSVRHPAENQESQVVGLRESIKNIITIIRKEAELIPIEHIFLGGISQGCATAIHVLLCGGIKLGGFIGLCSWLPFRSHLSAFSSQPLSSGEKIQQIRRIFNIQDGSRENSLSDLAKSSVFETPIFLGHSEDDDVVPIGNGEELCRTLRDLGFEVRWETYKPGGINPPHWINEPKGVDDLVGFLGEKDGCMKELIRGNVDGWVCEGLGNWSGIREQDGVEIPGYHQESAFDLDSALQQPGQGRFWSI